MVKWEVEEVRKKAIERKKSSQDAEIKLKSVGEFEATFKKTEDDMVKKLEGQSG